MSFGGRVDCGMQAAFGINIPAVVYGLCMLACWRRVTVKEKVGDSCI